MSETAEEIVAAAAERAKGKVLSDFSASASFVESPIERLFLAGLIAGLSDDPFHTIEILPPGSASFCDRYSIPTGSIHVWLQRKIGPYRADFIIEWQRDNRPILLVVECDGHDFHERTKEQARRDRARDRHLTLQGYHVIRFTGSELYADALKCADNALELLFSIGLR